LRFGLVRGIPLFILGMLIARLPTTISSRRADGLAIAAGVAVVALQVFGRFDHASLALLGLLIYAAGASGAKGWGWAGLAGRLSFSLFLINQLVAVAWFGLLRAVTNKLGLDGPLLWTAWAMALPACVVAAWLFERFVDTPLQAWIKGWSRKDLALKAEPALA
jgi:peptidoglycan/LPS O-acetylase OafA/YrhL